MKNFRKKKSNHILKEFPQNYPKDCKSLITLCLNGQSNRFLNEPIGYYVRRSPGFIYDFCKHYNPKINNTEFKKVLGDLFKEQVIQCLYCPIARAYVIMLTSKGFTDEILEYKRVKKYKNTYILNNVYRNKYKNQFDKNGISFNCLAGLVD